MTENKQQRKEVKNKRTRRIAAAAVNAQE